MPRGGLRGVDGVFANLAKWRVGRVLIAHQVAQGAICPMLTQKAKANAPWTDRTGNARRSLHSKSQVSAMELVITLHHGVEYGIFLEVCNAGRFAILIPTLNANKAQIMAMLTAAMRI